VSVRVRVRVRVRVWVRFTFVVYLCNFRRFFVYDVLVFLFLFSLPYVLW